MTIDEGYRILEIPRNSSPEEIKSAYLKLIKQWHPDVNKDPKAKEKAKKINEAYEILTKRRPRDYPQDLWESFFSRKTPFGSGVFDDFNFDFNSKVTKSSVVLEVDESNSKDLTLIPEILRKAGFIIKSFIITKYR